MRPDALLFGESQSRIVVSLKERHLSRLKEIAEREWAPMQVIGRVGGSRFTIRSLMRLSVGELRSIWSRSVERRMQ
jgi:phosphoribosylformylglycinamidine synthase